MPKRYFMSGNSRIGYREIAFGDRIKMNIENGIESFVHNFHNANSGKQFSFFSSGIAGGARDSYSILVSEARQDLGERAVVLDLGCGDGRLLELLSKDVSDSICLRGVDMSKAEIELAKARQDSERIHFSLGRAQRIAEINSSVDVVLSHMSLFLMEDVPTVIAEVFRILKPGGKFAAILPSSVEPSVAGRAFRTLLSTAIAEEQCGSLRSACDPNIFNNAGLKKLFGLEPSCAKFEMAELTVPFLRTPDELAEELMLIYDVGLLSAGRRARFSRDLLEELKKLTNEQGRVEYAISFKKVVTSKVSR